MPNKGRGGSAGRRKGRGGIVRRAGNPADIRSGGSKRPPMSTVSRRRAISRTAARAHNKGTLGPGMAPKGR